MKIKLELTEAQEDLLFDALEESLDTWTATLGDIISDYGTNSKEAIEHQQEMDGLSELIDKIHKEIIKTEASDPWGEDPKHPRKDWRHDVADDNTSLGYWDWVDSIKECEDEETATLEGKDEE